MFTPIGKSNLLSKMVESQIEEAIKNKKILPNSKLPSEQELCRQFKISRTALREALRMLAARGLITIVKGKGIYAQSPTAETVTDPILLYLQMQNDPHYILDVVHARQIIEPPIAASAAIHHTAEDAERLKKDFNDLATSDGDYQELSRLDMLFHLDIARASENAIIPLILEPIHRLAPRIKSSVYAAVTDAKQSALEWHEKILTAILKRNPEAARSAMTRHLEIAEKHDRQIILEQKKNTNKK